MLVNEYAEKVVHSSSTQKLSLSLFLLHLSSVCPRILFHIVSQSDSLDFSQCNFIPSPLHFVEKVLPRLLSTPLTKIDFTALKDIPTPAWQRLFTTLSSRDLLGKLRHVDVCMLSISFLAPLCAAFML